MVKKSQASTFQDLYDCIWYILQSATPRDSNSKYNHLTCAEEMMFKKTLVDTHEKALLSSLPIASFFGHHQGGPTALG